MSQTTRVMILDDHPLVRSGLEQLLADEPGFTVAASVDSSQQLLQALKTETPDLLLLDLTLREGNALDLIETITQRLPEVRILVVTMHQEALFAERCLRAGALGFVCKSEPTAVFRQAIRSVAAGEPFISSEVSSRVLTQMRQGQPKEGNGIESLSGRELTVFEAIGRGASIQEIAAQLYLSPKTVESYRDRIREKLAIPNSSALIRYATLWMAGGYLRLSN